MIAFYAAVHVVNAYLWETRRAEPRNHGERWTEVQRSLPINPCRIGYRALFLAGYRARYDETFRLAEQDARLLLDVDYRQVEATVMQALGQPVPAW